MKVKRLMELLSRADPEAIVCEFTERGAVEVDRVDVYTGNYYANGYPKLVRPLTRGVYVGIGNPGDFDVTESWDDCQQVFDLEDNAPVE